MIYNHSRLASKYWESISIRVEYFIKFSSTKIKVTMRHSFRKNPRSALGSITLQYSIY